MEDILKNINLKEFDIKKESTFLKNSQNSNNFEDKYNSFIELFKIISENNEYNIINGKDVILYCLKNTNWKKQIQNYLKEEYLLTLEEKLRLIKINNAIKFINNFEDSDLYRRLTLEKPMLLMEIQSHKIDDIEILDNVYFDKNNVLSVKNYCSNVNIIFDNKNYILDSKNDNNLEDNINTYKLLKNVINFKNLNSKKYIYFNKNIKSKQNIIQSKVAIIKAQSIINRTHFNKSKLNKINKNLQDVEDLIIEQKNIIANNNKIKKQNKEKNYIFKHKEQDKKIEKINNNFQKCCELLYLNLLKDKKNNNQQKSTILNKINNKFCNLKIFKNQNTNNNCNYIKDNKLTENIKTNNNKIDKNINTLNKVENKVRYNVIDFRADKSEGKISKNLMTFDINNNPLNIEEKAVELFKKILDKLEKNTDQLDKNINIFKIVENNLKSRFKVIDKNGNIVEKVEGIDLINLKVAILDYKTTALKHKEIVERMNKLQIIINNNKLKNNINLSNKLNLSLNNFSREKIKRII